MCLYIPISQLHSEGMTGMQKKYLYIPLSQLQRGGKTVYTEEVYIYIYQSVNYTEEVGQCIKKRYLYIPINQLHRGGKTMYKEEVPIYTNPSITQRRYDNV